LANQVTSGEEKKQSRSSLSDIQKLALATAVRKICAEMLFIVNGRGILIT
jgi:hypothetical protein